MIFEPKKAGFVLVSTAHGTMIVNRFDVSAARNGECFGMGHTILNEGAISMGDINILLQMLQARHKHFGPRVMMLDCGANIGTHTISLATAMTSWGNVAAFEPQETIFYALAGNIVLNNCFNAQAILAAVGQVSGTIMVPNLHFLEPGSYGSLELHEQASNEPIGQTVDYRNSVPVKMVSIDALNLNRVDLIKLDVEGMELEALYGAREILTKHLPVLFVEHIKTDVNELVKFLEDYGYSYMPIGINFLAVHQKDPCHELLVTAVKNSE